jgi:hypothetical protein
LADMLTDGFEWQARKFKERASQAVTYQRCDSATALSLQASPVRRFLEVVTNTQAVDKIELWDFQITATDLVFGGVIVRPKEGDTITWVYRGVTRVHKVLPAPQGAVWDFLDGREVQINVHTKRTDSGRC